MAETTSLLNWRAGNRTAGSNPALSASTNQSGFSSARLECLVWDQEAAGSNPATPTTWSKHLHYEGVFFMSYRITLLF